MKNVWVLCPLCPSLVSAIMSCLSSLSSDLSALLADPSNADIVIHTTGGGRVRAHRLILSARSLVFSTMLNNDMVENTTGVIKIMDFEHNVVEAMVRYIYSGKIDDRFSDWRALLLIGDKYEIQSLVEFCRHKLVKAISCENVLELAVFAETYSDMEILDNCCDFIANDLDVLGKNWEENISPKFTVRILKSLKRIHGLVTISRYETFSDSCSCSSVNNQRDSISFETSSICSLSEIGLFGSNTKETLPINLTIKKGSETIFSEDISYNSTGSNTPIKIPLPQRILVEPDSDYTVSVVNSGPTFRGERGRDSVEITTGEGRIFKVCFVDIDDESSTDVESGQIPLLVFKV